MAVLNDADFTFLSEMVRRESAIVLEPEKMYLVESRLSPIAKSMGLTSIEELVGQLRKTSLTSNGAQKAVVEAMTTNETSFFRDIHPFDALRKSVLPELMERRQALRTLNFWCAAASSGQEPYSVAMLMREHFPAMANWKVNFVATDLSTEILANARAGQYTQFEVNRGLPATLLVKYFEKNGLAWKIKDELRNMIDFKPMNLARPWPEMPRMDIIFMRNVLIYFDVATKKQILSRVRHLLADDGYLFLGGAETTLNLDERFERVQFDGAGCYKLRTN